MPDYYQPDLAYVHNADYGQLALRAAQIIIEMRKGKDFTTQMVVDLGCGSGILAAELAACGMKVLGVDLSADMLELARAASPHSTFVQASLFDVDIPPCDVVSSIGECVCYLFDEKSNIKALEQLFTKVFAALHSGGHFVFDILSPDVVPQRRILEHENWSMFLDVSIDGQTHILSRDILLFRKQGEHYIRSREVHRQQLYHVNDIQQMLEACGFAVQPVNNYNGYPFRQGHNGFICVKPL